MAQRVEPDEVDNFIAAACIAMAVAGMLILFVTPRSEWRLWRLGVAFFVAGLAGTLLSFLIGSPDVLADVREHIGLVLLGLLIATLQVIRLIKK